MRMPQAVFEVERVAAGLSAAGQACTIEQIDWVLADSRTAVAHLYFAGAEEPLTLLLDLEMSASEETFDRDALTRALLTSSSAASLQ